MTPENRKWLADRFSGRVQFDEPLSGHTSFRVGGPADALVAPDSEADLATLIAGCRRRDLPVHVIGDGTNTLVRDGGIRGVVIALTRAFSEIARTGGNSVTAMAGARLAALCRFAAGQGLGGLNFAQGIPGTVGGAIIMNAGTAGGCMAGVLASVRILGGDGRIRRLTREQLDFEYRRLVISTGKRTAGTPPVVLAGRFTLVASDPAVLQAEARRLLAARKRQQPVHLACAGCFFKNPPSGRSAGQLIDAAGLKGKRIGGAEISPVHANFIVNRQHASAADILALMACARETVERRFNIRLEPEVKIVGQA